MPSFDGGSATPRDLAASLWNRAATDPLVLSEREESWLLQIVDSEGASHEWLESDGATEIGKRIRDADAAVAGLALKGTIIVGMARGRKRYEWLLVLAADEARDCGYFAPLDRTATTLVGTRAEWKFERRVVFEPEVTDYLAGFRVMALHLLREGVRSAGTRRSRGLRVRRGRGG